MTHNVKDHMVSIFENEGVLDGREDQTNLEGQDLRSIKSCVEARPREAILFVEEEIKKRGEWCEKGKITFKSR